jgi:hypothetical protein
MANLPFVKFALLPIEIRLKICQYANLHRTIFLCTDDKVVTKHPYFRIRAAAPPTLLAVNREFHNETLNWCTFTRCLDSTWILTWIRFTFLADVVGTAILILSIDWQHSWAKAPEDYPTYQHILGHWQMIPPNSYYMVRRASAFPFWTHDGCQAWK